jgi:hypothetical protein
MSTHAVTHGEFTFTPDYREAAVGARPDTRVHAGPRAFVAGDPFEVDKTFTKNKVRLLTWGSDTPDLDLLKWLDTSPRKSGRTTTLLDVVKTPSPDRWEDLLFAQAEPDVIPLKAVLVRPGAALPDTFYAVTSPLAVPPAVRALGAWLTATRNPKCNWRFSARWSFPDWIVDRLPRRTNWRAGYAFADLSAAGLDSLLAEYALLLDRGNHFAVDGRTTENGWNLLENLRTYLRHRYGGGAGLRAQLDRWAEAQDVRTQGELSAHEPFERPDHPAWVKKNPKGPRRQVPLEKADEVLWDATFMGSVDDPAMANLRDQGRTFDHETPDGRKVKLRKYHEGSTLLRRKTAPRVDDDPSPFVTCGQVSGRGDLRRRAGEPRRKGAADPNPVTAYLPVPEGLASYEEWDFHPTADHLPAIVAQLEARGVAHDVADQPAGCYRVADERGVLAFDEAELVELKDDTFVPKPLRPWTVAEDFCPLSQWNRHWDGDKKAVVPGRSEGMSRDERKLWVYARGGQWLTWTLPDGSERSLFVNKTSRPDSLPSRSARRKLMAVPADVPLPERALAKFLWFDRKNGAYVPPRSFKGEGGKAVHLRPKPLDCPATAWGTWKRCWAELQTVRQLLAEERWEKLAFAPEALFGSAGAYAADHRFAPEAFASPEAEAEARIAAHLDTLDRRVREAGLPDDVVADFTAEIRAAHATVHDAVRGTKGGPAPVDLASMAGPVAPPPPRKVVARDPLDARILESYRLLWKKYTDLAKARPDRRDAYLDLARKCVERATGIARPAQVVRTTEAPPAKEPIARPLALTRLYVLAQSANPRTAAKARRILARRERPGDVTRFRAAGRVRYSHYRRLRRTALYGVPAGQK